MPTITQLSLYQGALRLLAEQKLSSISEAREARYLLDDVWSDGVIDECLQLGQWKFATRTVMLDSSPSVSSDFGLQFAFEKPSDFIRTVAISSDEFFNNPLARYADENGHWWADQDPIYVKYVSNDEEFGTDYSLWPVNFKNMVEAYMASKIVTALTNGESKKDGIRKDLKLALDIALGTDAQAGPVVVAPRGYWAGARGGSYRRNGRGPDR